MDFFQFVIAFNLGLFSTLHCLGMCGGIIGALSLGVEQKKSHTLYGRIKHSVAYNTGRITSYAIAGAIAGFAGQHIVTGIMPEAGHRVLQYLAAVILVLIGLHLAGWLPGLGKIESVGISIWRVIQPIGRRFLPVRTMSQAYAVGMIWGWLPCALVYSVLLWSLTAGNIFTGATLMFAFGLGTLPGMITTGVVGSSLQEIIKNRYLRIWAGIIIIIFGIASLFLHIPFHKNNLHEHHITSVDLNFLYHHHPSGFVGKVFQDHHTGRI